MMSFLARKRESSSRWLFKPSVWLHFLSAAMLTTVSCVCWWPTFAAFAWHCAACTTNHCFSSLPDKYCNEPVYINRHKFNVILIIPHVLLMFPSVSFWFEDLSKTMRAIRSTNNGPQAQYGIDFGFHKGFCPHPQVRHLSQGRTLRWMQR